VLFKETCHSHKVNPLIIQDAIKQYHNLEKHLVINEPAIVQAPAII
jgi:hypothetical protein